MIGINSSFFVMIVNVFNGKEKKPSTYAHEGRILRTSENNGTFDVSLKLNHTHFALSTSSYANLPFLNMLLIT